MVTKIKKVSVGDVSCLTEVQKLHSEVARTLFGIMCTCGSLRKCAVNKNKSICSDFELS